MLVLVCMGGSSRVGEGRHCCDTEWWDSCSTLSSFPPALPGFKSLSKAACTSISYMAERMEVGVGSLWGNVAMSATRNTNMKRNEMQYTHLFTSTRMDG